MKTIRLLALAPLLACAAAAPAAGPSAPDDLDRYNVVWTAPGATPAGSMPAGNGEVGLNVWVEEGGDLCFYIARTDTWSETCRLLKLGRVRVSLSPNPFARGAPFRQELRLREGAIAIVAGDPPVKLRVFVDADAPVVHVTGESARPVEVRASAETWRTQRRRIQGEALQSNWTMRDAPGSVELWESADVVAAAPADAVVWYHRNESSIVPLTLRHQGLETLADLVKDPLLNRTSGGRMEGAGFARDGANSLKSGGPVARFSLRIVAHSSQPDSAAAWEKEAAEIAAKAAGAEAAAKSTAAWWDAFWGRSWIFAEEGEAAAAGVPANRHPLRLGADSGGGSRWPGLMSRASVYGRPLREAEVRSLASGKPGDAAAVKEGLLASWRLDGLRGGAVPGGGLDAKPSGRPAFREEDGTPAASLAEGHFEAAGDDPRFAFPKGFTLEAWIRPTGVPGRIFDKITAGQSDGFLFDTHPGKALRLIVGSETFVQDNVLRANAWNHVAAVVDPQTGARRLYLDGKAVRSEGGGGGSDAAPPSRITQAYVLQRWMAACAGRGNYPIKFNGSLFTVEPEYTGGPKQDADWRRWGDCFWWQNTRLPYFPMPASGDFDLLQPLFRFYRSHLPLAKARAKLYFDADGAYFQETVSCFGTASNGDYGWGRGNHKPNEFLNMYIRHIWQQGLELVMLMQDAYDHTQDGKFLSEELLPMAREVLRYFETRFPKDAAGKLAIAPTQSVETYWYDVVNDTPCVAGLHAVVDRLLALKEAPAADRALWSRMKAAAPPLPVRERSVLPAEKYKNQRSNCENPELYAIWPFRLYSVGRPDLEVGQETWRRRADKGMNGWSYDGQSAAIVGLADEAKRQILHKVRNSHPNHRFPAMWGPNFDWLPDQDHGSNVLLTLQHMVLLADGDKVHLLPAWPKEWNLKFRLHAPRKTVIEGEWRGGKMVSLKVEPASRKGDVAVVESR
jgi:hypothetical protein